MCEKIEIDVLLPETNCRHQFERNFKILIYLYKRMHEKNEGNREQ